MAPRSSLRLNSLICRYLVNPLVQCPKNNGSSGNGVGHWIVCHGGIYDDTLNPPFGGHCWLHMKFDPNSLNTGQAVGECEDYFDRFEGDFTRVDCSSVPDP